MQLDGNADSPIRINNPFQNTQNALQKEIQALPQHRIPKKEDAAQRSLKETFDGKNPLTLVDDSHGRDVVGGT